MQGSTRAGEGGKRSTAAGRVLRQSNQADQGKPQGGFSARIEVSRVEVSFTILGKEKVLGSERQGNEEPGEHNPQVKGKEGKGAHFLRSREERLQRVD